MSGHDVSRRKYQIRWPQAAVFFAYTLLIRLLPYLFYHFGMPLDPGVSWYPWNFSPTFAVCLFTGAFCADRRLSLLLPVGTFLLSDLGIWALTGRFDWAFYPAQFAVYGCLLCCTSIGFLLRNEHSALRVAGAGLTGCIVFFIATNFAMWALWDTYPHTPAGLVQCYVAAIPYFRNSLLGTAVFSAILFSPVCLREVSSVPSGRLLAEQAG